MAEVDDKDVTMHFDHAQPNGSASTRVPAPERSTDGAPIVGPSTIPALLGSRRIRLRPAGAADGQFLYQLLFEHGLTALPILPVWVADSLAFKDAAAQFVVEWVANEQMIGYTSLHELDPSAGHVQVGVYSMPGGTAPGLGAEAALLTINYAFAMWPIRKVYCHTTEANMKYFGGAISKIARREGLLRQHKYFQGRSWDLQILAIYRDDWVRTGLPLAQRLAEHPAATGPKGQ
ncbi:MAG: GNAT family N-acetyltransferase [Acidimicrobiales bacterium]